MHIQYVSRAEEWVAARRALVDELTRLRSQLYADPCALPWLQDAPDGLLQAAGGMPFALMLGVPEHGVAAWSGLLDNLEGYLRTLN